MITFKVLWLLPSELEFPWFEFLFSFSNLQPKIIQFWKMLKVSNFEVGPLILFLPKSLQLFKHSAKQTLQVILICFF